MKNKEKDLTKIKVEFLYLTDGCGKKTQKPRVMKITSGNEIKTELVTTTAEAFAIYNKWLESET